MEKTDRKKNFSPFSKDLGEPLEESLSRRLPWLLFLLALGMVVSGVVGLFEDVVKEVSVLVSFQSLILGMAGNVGTQSLAVTVRALTEKSLSKKEKRLLVGKEARVGLVQGIVLGFLSFALASLYLVLGKDLPLSQAGTLALCAALALFTSTFLAGLSGTAIPLLLQRANIDPAVSSGPLITTLNDLVALLSYYGFARLFLLE